MVVRDNRCTKCNGRMEQGFLLDNTSGGIANAEWASGEAKRSKWMGVRMKGRRKLEITAYRCIDCGHIELYTAVPPRTA